MNPTENPSFIRLLQLMKEDATFAHQIQGIINLSQDKRASILTGVLVEMNKQGAPEEHKEVFEFLKQEPVCEALRAMFTDA